MFRGRRNRMMDNNDKISLLKKATSELLSLESRINIIQNNIIDSVDDLSDRHDILNDITYIGNIITELTCTKIPDIITKLQEQNYKKYNNYGNLFGNNGMAIANQNSRNVNSIRNNIRNNGMRIINQYGGKNNNYIGNNGFQYGNNNPMDLNNNFVNNNNNFVNNKCRNNPSYWDFQ